MLRGFEHITTDLTDYERDVLVPEFVRRFNRRVGAHRAVTNGNIIKGMKMAGFDIGSGIRVRRIINYIRNNKLTNGCLIASGKGYYVSFDPVEIKAYMGSLEGRENEIRRVRESVKSYLSNTVFGRQSQLKF